jgi:hypothetical protein
VGHDQGKDHDLPPSPVQITMGQPLNQSIVQTRNGAYLQTNLPL